MSLPRGAKWAIGVTIGVCAVLLILFIVATSVVPLSSETLRQSIIDALSARLDSNVELGSIKVRALPRLSIEGDKLTIRHRRDRDKPLIAVQKFSVSGDLRGLYRNRVAHVELLGLEITIPPDDKSDDDKGRDRSDKKHHKDASGADPKNDQKNEQLGREIVIDELVSKDARLIIVSSKPHKAPKVWDIHQLRMQNVGVAEPMPFKATLRNAVPPGEIGTNGKFGPWQKEDPGRTPLDGTFVFERADLGFFKGISGLLSARGNFGGALGRIDIHGQTDTPKFGITMTGHTVPLETKYHAIVDGTNGDTILEKIDATFLKTSLVARGGVLDTPGADGRTVSLDVQMDQGRLEDVLQLAVKASKPVMTGALQLTTKLVIPPGHADVVDKLRLDGRFDIAKAMFTNFNIQQKINELSRRGQGKTPEEQQRVASDFEGQFKLADGVLTLPDLSFATPGAVVRLDGTYALRQEVLDFRGSLLLDAKVSQTTTGMKRVLLKAVDPLFSKDGGGSEIPIKITGSRSAPAFGLDTKRVFSRKN